MAVTSVTAKMAAGINYTHVTDSSADWSSPTLPNNTYFYDKVDKLVHYKDSTGVILEIFANGGTGGAGLLHGVATGTNTYAVTITGVTAYTDGDAYAIRFTNGNDADSTININGLGVKTLVKEANIQVTGGDIVSGQELIIIYDGTNFQCVNVAPNQLFAFVTNDDSVTITKGQPVYAFGATGNRMSVKLAANTADATSAQTVGVVFSSSIAANQRGFIITQGVIGGLNTSMYNAGDQLYLGATAGSLTSIKPFAPNHLVYIGIVERANNGNGQIYVKPQNGYELDELHDVDLISIPPADADVLTYNSLTDLWEPAAIPGTQAGGNQLISGSSSWSNTGLTFNTTTLIYTIDGTKYSATPQNVTLAASDPSNPRFDAIVVDAAGVVSVITGTPASNPLVPSIPGTQVLVQYVLVGAGATTPNITNEIVYNDGSTPNWIPGANGGVTIVSTTSTTPTPFLGTECTLINAGSYSTASFLKYAKASGSISTNTYAFLSFRIYLLPGSSGRDVVVGLHNGGQYINRLYSSSWGLSKLAVGSWQLVVIPLAAFIGTSGITNITEVRFHPFGTVTGTTQFAIDDVKFQSGYGPQSNVSKIDILDTGVTVGSTAKLNFINGQYSVAVATNDIPNNKVDVKFDVTGIPLTTVLAAGNTTFGQSITLSNANDFINVFTAGSFIGGTGIPTGFTGIKFGGDGNGITLQQYNNGIGDPNYGAVSLNVNNKTLVIRAVLGSTFAGAQYFADYSANYTNRSLVDKAYVDNKINTQPEVIQVAASDETSNLTTGTAKVTFRMPYAMTLTAVRASLSTAQTSGTLVTVDINLNGTSVLGTKLTFENGQKTTTTATTPATITTSALTDDGEITIDIDAIGLAGAKGLKITLIGTRV